MSICDRVMTAVVTSWWFVRRRMGSSAQVRKLWLEMRQISAIISLNFGVFGAVTEQLAGAARRCNSEAKAKGRKEQLEETEEQ